MRKIKQKETKTTASNEINSKYNRQQWVIFYNELYAWEIKVRKKERNLQVHLAEDLWVVNDLKFC